LADLRFSRAVFTAVLLTAACGPRAFDARVRDYVRLAVALEERDPDSIDFYYGPAEWVADVRKNPPGLKEIRASALTLADRFDADSRLRSQRLAAQTRAIAARADELLGAQRSFDQKTQTYFGVTARAADPDEMAQVRAELNDLLPGRGSLAERYASFDQQFLIPPDRLEGVVARAIQGCRDQTRNHVRLPAGEFVRVEFVHDKPWSAFSRYQGNFTSVISINADLPLTVDRALAVACHEAYPGHHTQNVLQEIQFVRDNRWLEWTAQPTFSPQSLVSEALATYAVNIAFPAPERLRFERDALFPIAGLNAKEAARYEHVQRLIDRLAAAEPDVARDFLDGKLEWARAANALEQQALMAHPEQTLKYLNEYRAYMITYTLGPELIARQVHDWRQFEQLMTDPNAARLIMKR
jgi:hypothetical protein